MRYLIRGKWFDEARIVTPWGWNIPVLFEPVEPYEGEKEKQDCEMAAFKRLEKRLKAAFPHRGLCILGDALYACRPVVTCRQWHPSDECYDGEFLTSFPVNDGERARLIAEWGRRRWNIENGFHAEKHGGFGAPR